MGALGFFVAIILCGLIVALSNWWDDRKDKKKQREQSEREKSPNADLYDKAIMAMENEALEKSKTTMEETKGTRDLLLDILTKMGCQYEIDEEDNQIRFMWQGGHFTADAENDCPFMVVWYLYWDEYELYDIETLSRVKRIINDANIKYNINVVYSINEAGSTFHVHSKKHFLLISQIPDIEGYMQSVLGQFYNVRHYIESELEKLKNEEERIAQ